MTRNLCLVLVMGGCVLCGAQAERHHYPRTRRYGATVIPLCHDHHMAWHNGMDEVRDRVQAVAPLYFAVHGELTRELWEACLTAGRRRLRLKEE